MALTRRQITSAEVAVIRQVRAYFQLASIVAAVVINSIAIVALFVILLDTIAAESYMTR